MNFNGRNPDGFYRIEKSDACVGISAGVDYDSVKNSEGFLNFVNKSAFVVALEKFDGNVVFFSMGGNFFKEGIIILASVNSRFADSEHIEVRSVNHQNFHFENPPLFFCKLPLRSSLHR